MHATAAWARAGRVGPRRPATARWRPATARWRPATSTSRVWHHTVSPPQPSGTPTLALRIGPYPRQEVRRRASCTHTAHGTVGRPLVGAPAPALLHLLHRRRRSERPSPLPPPAPWRAAQAHMRLGAPRARCRGMLVQRLAACRRAGAVAAAVEAPAPCPKYCIQDTILFTQKKSTIIKKQYCNYQRNI